MTLADFAARRIFQPLRMADTHFVVPESMRSRIARRRLVAQADPTAYAASYETREFEETPWAGGGAFSTAMDMAVCGQMLLQRGTAGGVRVLGPATVAAMTGNQISGVGMQFDDEYFPEASWGWGGASMGAGRLGAADRSSRPGHLSMLDWEARICGWTPPTNCSGSTSRCWLPVPLG